MAYSLKQLWSAVAVSLVTTTSFVGAHVIGNNPCCYNDVCCPPNYCCNSWCGDLSITLEALVWKATEDGLAFGTECHVPFAQTTTTPPTTSFDVDCRVKHPHFKWDWGFRLGFAYALPCDCWGLALIWSDFKTHGRNFHHGFSGTDAGFTTSFFVPGWGRRDWPGITDTEARLKLRYDTLDLELGRPFCISQCLVLRPHIGVRGAWIRQHYEIVNTISAIVGGAVEVETPVQDVRLKCDWEAVGLRGGLDSMWDIGCGVSLYGQAAASVLYGRYDIISRDDYESPLAGEAGTFYHVHQKDEFWACRAVTDLALGLQWRTCCCNDCLSITFSVDWEHHLFFDLNEFEDFSQLTHRYPTDSTQTGGFDSSFGQVKNPEFSRGNLCVKGVAFGVRLDY